MRKTVKILLLAMAIATVFYFVWLASAITKGDTKVYAAFEYDEQPPEWYEPQELGIIEINEYKDNVTDKKWLQLVVDPAREPFPLQEERPVLIYEEVFYRVAELWVTPGIPESLKQGFAAGAVAITVGWGLTCVVISVKTEKQR